MFKTWQYTYQTTPIDIHATINPYNTLKIKEGKKKRKKFLKVKETIRQVASRLLYSVYGLLTTKKCLTFTFT